MLEKLEDRGIPKEYIKIVEESGIRLKEWFGGFESAQEFVKITVEFLKNHALIPKDVVIR